MSVYERENFAQFVAHIVAIRKASGYQQEAQTDLANLGGNDEETVALQASSPEAAVAARKALRTIHQDFPYGSSVAEQSAYFLRGLMGLDPFGDGDRTTAWTYLTDLLASHGWTIEGNPDELTATLLAGFKANYPGGFQRRHALDRDELFTELTDWFSEHLHPSSSGADQHL